MGTATRLSLSQIAVLCALLVEGRELTNAELTANAGTGLTGEDRKRLVADGLVEQRRVGQSYAFQLSPVGWNTGLSLLAAQERGKGAAATTVGILLSGLTRALAAKGTDPRAFFSGSPPQLQEGVGVRDPASPAFAGDAAASTAVASEQDIEERIRTGYAKLATEPAGWVSLADLRELLDDVARPALDAALRRVAVQPDVRLIPVANLKSLSTRERDAALRFGGEDNHALAIA